ncbi:hypothetical protein NST84_03710 [Paenibacillus sp. FSL R7-0345]|uniref:hypothetical protein n=1 Tax=Paenibacillus sp. FSL R7-0345 TaxID=2954535 RepID=UPI003159DE50
MDREQEHPSLQMCLKTLILKLLQTEIEAFYFNAETQYKMSLLALHPSDQARQIEAGLTIIDELIISIERNMGCGNLKRALHFVVILQKQINQIQTKLEQLNFLELVR